MPESLLDAFEITEGEGPVCAVALHHGHALRAEVAARMALPEPDRLREEDPYTGEWTAAAPTRVVARRSRFEVDLNRPRDRAVYRTPADAWGLRVWQQAPPEDLIARSLALHDAFYDRMAQVLDRMAARHGRFVVLDLHSYNYRRQGPDVPVAPDRHPDINLGTGSLDLGRWGWLVEHVLRRLEQEPILERPLWVGENVVFQGGAFSRWVHARYPETGCALALEFKKFFMDEWTGALFPDVHRRIGEALARLAQQIEEALSAHRAAKTP